MSLCPTVLKMADCSSIGENVTFLWLLVICLSLFSPFVKGQNCADGSHQQGPWTSWTCDYVNNMQTQMLTCVSDTDNLTRTTLTHRREIDTIYSWTSWSPWAPNCGLGKRATRYQTCPVDQDVQIYCSTCGNQRQNSTQSSNDLLPACCEDLNWKPWSSWLPTCTEHMNECIQSRMRKRNISLCEHDSCLHCKPDVADRTALPQSWSQWTSWSDILKPCSSGSLVSRSRNCAPVNNPSHLPVVPLCSTGASELENGCCRNVSSWTWWNYQPPCQRNGCVDKCRWMESVLPSDKQEVQLSSAELYCVTCDVLGPDRNITASLDDMSTIPAIILWPTVSIGVISILSLIIITTSVVFCYKCYKKYKHSYFLMEKRKTFQGVHGDIPLENMTKKDSAPASDEYAAKEVFGGAAAIGDYWKNPLLEGLEENTYEMSDYSIADSEAFLNIVNDGTGATKERVEYFNSHGEEHFDTASKVPSHFKVKVELESLGEALEDIGETPDNGAKSKYFSNMSNSLETDETKEKTPADQSQRQPSSEGHLGWVLFDTSDETFLEMSKNEAVDDDDDKVCNKGSTGEDFSQKVPLPEDELLITDIEEEMEQHHNKEEDLVNNYEAISDSIELDQPFSKPITDVPTASVMPNVVSAFATTQEVIDASSKKLLAISSSVTEEEDHSKLDQKDVIVNSPDDLTEGQFSWETFNDDIV